MDNFKKEVQEMSTADILLILEDQLDLYTDEEIEVLKNELNSRPDNALELEAEEYEKIERQKEFEQQQAEQKRRKEATEKALKNRLDNLKARGYEGYWEYKTITLTDDNSGAIYASTIESTLNKYALDGWRLKNSYANELGKNSESSGVGGFSTGTNSTMDQHIFILERFIKF